MYKITQPIKINHPVFQSHSCLSRQTTFCLWNVYLSLNKPISTLLWLTLEFFPAQIQGPSLGQSPGLIRDLGHDYPLTPHFPAVGEL